MIDNVAIIEITYKRVLRSRLSTLIFMIMGSLVSLFIIMLIIAIGTKEPMNFSFMINYIANYYMNALKTGNLMCVLSVTLSLSTMLFIIIRQFIRTIDIAIKLNLLNKQLRS